MKQKIIYGKSFDCSWVHGFRQRFLFESKKNSAVFFRIWTGGHSCFFFKCKFTAGGHSCFFSQLWAELAVTAIFFRSSGLSLRSQLFFFARDWVQGIKTGLIFFSRSRATGFKAKNGPQIFFRADARQSPLFFFAAPAWAGGHRSFFSRLQPGLAVTGVFFRRLHPGLAVTAVFFRRLQPEVTVTAVFFLLYGIVQCTHTLSRS